MKEFKPMTIGPIFDQTIRLVFNKDSMRLLGLFAAIMVVPVVLLAIFAGNGWNDLLATGTNGLRTRAAVGFDWGVFFACLGLSLFAVFVGLLYSLMLTDANTKRFLGRPYKIGPSFVAGLRHLPGLLLYTFFLAIYYLFLGIVFSLITGVIMALSIPLFSAGILVTVILVILAVIIGGALVCAASTFVRGIVPAYMGDNLRLFPAIGRWLSFSVKNYFRITGVSLLFQLIVLVGSLILYIILSIPFALIMVAANVAGGNSSFEQTIPVLLIISFLMYFTIIVFNLVFTHAFNVVIYFNQKIKHAGLGAELLAEQFLKENTPVEGEPSAP